MKFWPDEADSVGMDTANFKLVFQESEEGANYTVLTFLLESTQVGQGHLKMTLYLCSYIDVLFYLELSTSLFSPTYMYIWNLYVRYMYLLIPFTVFFYIQFYM